MANVLHGIRVLDFGRYIAGPYCAALLGEFGADVIRIEKRKGSEDRFQAPVSDDGAGALFLQMNRNKRSLTLNPMSDQGKEVVRRLVATADVVVANLPPATLVAMGLDYSSLRAIKPDIILTTATAYGKGGPYSDRVGFDGVGQVMSGAVFMTGEPDQPYRMPASWVDFSTALHCAFGTLLALMQRKMTGQGQVVEGALLASALAVNNSSLIEQALVQPNRKANGNRGQTAGPLDLFNTKDGWILVQVVGQPLFERWVSLMGEPDLLTDARFKDDMARGRNGAELSARMSRWCAQMTRNEALDILGRAKIPAAPVLSPQEALDDPHIKAFGLFEYLDYPGLPRPAPVAKAPIQLSENPGSIRRRPPLLGEQTEEILSEVGYLKDEISSLREQNIV